MMSDFHFLRPLWLIALGVPPLIIWLALHSSDFTDRWKRVVAPHLLKNLLIEPGQKKRNLPVFLLSGALALATIGAAGPTWMREPPPFVTDTASLVLVVDLSTTMDAIDISPSRIERVKLKIHDILATREGARTAVVAYSGTSHLVVPLTDDVDLIQTYTDALSTRIMPKPGKDTSAALKMADELLVRDEVPGTIVLLTDGIEPAAINAAKNVQSSLIILGVGTRKGGVIRTPDGGFANDLSGGHLNTKLDVDALKDFATQTQSDVATITEDDADVKWVAENIHTNFSRQTSNQGDRWHDVGWWFLIPCTTLLGLLFRKGWIVKLSVFLITLQIFPAPPASANGFADMWLTHDQQGRIAYDRKAYSEAASLFDDPMWRGIAFYRANNYQQALEAFAAVDSPESWYNQGNTLLHLADFSGAVDAYNKALKGRPNWPDAIANLAIAQKLLKRQQDEEEEQQQDPNQKPDSIEFDDKGKKGKAGEVEVAEQTSEMWMNNIKVSPADLLARKFSLEAARASQ
jgi:Ca-activated chloride channel family protein